MMHARLLRSTRPALLWAGLASLIALSACADNATNSAQVETTAAKTTANVAAESSAKVSVQPESKQPSGDLGPSLSEMVDQRKQVSDPNADAARKEAYLKNKSEGAASVGIDRAEFKREMSALSNDLAKGAITKQEYEARKYDLEQRMRSGATEAPKPIDPNGAKLVFAHKDFDFGEVWDTQALEHNFVFENQGGDTLEITQVKPSCGCTTTSLARTSFEPGQGEEIPIVWKPKGIGPQKKTVTVSYNNGPDQILNISATLKQFVALEPTLLRLGDLAQHEEHHAELKLILADKNFQITSIKPTSPHLAATEKSRDAEGNIILDVVIKENAPWGNFNARLEIEGTGVTEPGEKPVTHTVMTQVIAKMFGDIRVVPEQIQLGVVEPNQKFSGEALIYHVKGDEFDFAELYVRFSRPEQMTVRSEKTTHDGKPALRVIVEGDTTGFEERYVRGTIFFKTSLGDSESQQLQIAGTVR